MKTKKRSVRKKIEILPFVTLDLLSHIHKDWFEVKKDNLGTYIMCPEGCRRLLAKEGYIAEYDKEKELWVKIKL